ncbi:MAG TPA: MEDS domain-containing protein [Thermoanaerobaculia bacterium]|nr:MEDS domain-containing protein [Thermoanaerobaculia bacterium]
MNRSSTPSGIEAIGEVPFGTHFCQFYRSKQDLVDTLGPYFLEGLRNNELCLWVTSESLRADEARALLREALPDFDAYEASGQIGIYDFLDWYLKSGGTPPQALQAWLDHERLAMEQGYQGLRLTGDTAWLDSSGWDEFVAYEQAVNGTFRNFRIVGLCTYSLEKCSAEDVIDVCSSHQFALTRRQGKWELIESSPLKVAKSELERRVEERTSELEAALRARDEFLAMLAHELRNPLAPIRNAAQVIRLLGPANGHMTWARDVIDRQVHQLSRLVDDLLDVSRVTRGRVELHKEEIDLATVVAHAVETSRPWIDERRHTLTVSLPNAPVQLHADPARLSQVVSNLLNNACKYMEEGGRICLTAEQASEVNASEVRIRVKDEGIGIPKEMLPRIFELFTQLNRSLDRSEGGLGIGLALVCRLVELHGGKVQAFSDGPGRGSELVVTLPVLRVGKVPQPASAEAPAESRPVPGRRVLVADDNRDAAESLGMLLELAGHEVRLAFDGQETLDAAGDFKPEVLLLDIGLPRMDGFEVAERLRKDSRHDGMLLVAVTGYGTDSDRNRGRSAGFDHHLVKPVDPIVLRDLIAGS